MPILRDLLSHTEPVKRARMPRLGGTSTAAGVSVDAERALQVSAVYGCVRLISESIAQLPLHVYKRTEQGRQPVENHPLLPLLTDRPNPDIDSGEFVRAILGWMLLRGNGIAYREIGGDGRTKGLWPIAPTSVEPARTTTGKMAYEVTLNDAEYVPGFTPGRKRVVPQERILHFRAFGMGTWGLSPIGLARTKIGTSFAAEEYGAGFFARGAVPGGALKADGDLTDEQFDRLNQQWNDSHGGFGNSHKPAILENVSWENIGLPPDEAQFLETQKYTASTIAGHVFFVPPHLIGDVERSTSWGSGIAEQGVAFVRYSLMPWIVRLERVLNQLLPESGMYVKFNTAALERGDIKTRYESYALGRQWGFKSVNDIKQLEDEQPVDGGDVYLQPMNMVPVGTYDDPERSVATEELGHRGARRELARRSSSERRRIAKSFEKLIADADGQLARLERSEVNALIEQYLYEGGSVEAFAAAVRELYNGKITDESRKRFEPIFATLTGEIAAVAVNEVGREDPPDLTKWVAAYTSVHVQYRARGSASKLEAQATVGAGEVRAKLDKWVEDRPAKTARWEATQLSRAASREAWREAGVSELRWRANGDTCDICQRLDGKVVGIEQAFAEKGDLYPGGDDQEDLTVGRPTFHPPIHPGCDCDIEVT